jgi:predicted Zn-dependent peptidase
MEASFVHDEPWGDVVAEAARVRAVTRADVVRVANQYLTDDVVVARKVVQPVSPPHITKPRITPFKVDPGRHSAFADAILAMPVTPIDPVAIVEGKDFVRQTLKTGELISVENHRNDLFALSYTYDYARTDDKLACFAFDVLTRAGAGARSAAELGRALYALGVEVSFDCGLDRASIVLTGIDRNLEPALALVRDWIAKPQIDGELVRKSVDTAKTWRTTELGDPATISQAVYALAAYGEQSTWRQVPSNRELAAATPAQIVALVGRYQHLAHHTAYFGPRTAAAAAAVVTFGDGTVATAPRKPFHYRPPQVTAADQDNAQTKINLVWPRPPATEDERALGLVYYYYAGTLIYREVREVRGLAYSVTAGWRAAERSGDDASLYAYIATQGDKTDDAIAAIIETLHQPVDPHRFAEARTTIDEAHRAWRTEPRDIAAEVRGWEDEGVRADPSEDRVRRALAVDPAALQAWSERLLAAKPVISVVGARKKLDEAKLAKLGTVVWIDPKHAFGY